MAWPETPLNPFYEAPQVVNNTRMYVQNQQTAAIAKADQLRLDATNAISSMARRVAGMKTPAGMAPGLDLVAAPIMSGVNLSPLPSTDFGQVGSIPSRTFQPTAGSVGSVAVDIDDFDPAYTQFDVPPAPTSPYTPSFPSAPSLAGVSLPQSPTLQFPLQPVLDDLRVLSFQFSQMPTLDVTSPVFRDTPVNTVLNWSEPPYQKVIIDESIDVIRRMFAGGTGLPPAVERAMWERANSREDIELSRNVSEAMVEFSSRGFALPPGALLSRVDMARKEAALRKQSLGREVLIKIADTQIENLRFACEQAIGAEQALMQLWNQAAQRGFEIAKYQIDAQLALLNANIAIYNAQQSEAQMRVTVFRAEVEARGLELQQMRLELDNELAKGQINEQKVKVYSEMNRALLTRVEVFKGQIQGAQLQQESQKLELDKFTAQIQAEAERVKADRSRFEIFQSQVQGETAKAQLVQAQAQAYSAYVSGKKAAADVNIAEMNAELSRDDHRLRAFLGNLEVDKAVLQSQLAAVQSKAEAHRTNTSRFVAESQVKLAASEFDLKRYEVHQRQSIALYEAEMRRYIADMEHMMRAASLQLEGTKAIGQAYSTLAAGATAGISFSASLGASGSVSAGGSSGVSNDRRYSENHNYDH